MNDIIVNPMFLIILSTLVSVELLLNRILTRSYETGSLYHGFRNLIAISISAGLASIALPLYAIDIVAVLLSALTLAILIAATYSLNNARGETLFVASAASFIASLVNFIIGVAIGIILILSYPWFRRTKSSELRRWKLLEILASFEALLLVSIANVTLMTLLVLGILV